MANYCSNCGNKLEDDMKFCSACGASVQNNSAAPQQPYYGQQQQQPYYGQQQPNYGYQPSYNNYQQTNTYQMFRMMLGQLSGKIKTEGIIWLVIGILQIITAFVYILIGLDAYDYEFLILMGILIGIVGIANIIISVNLFKYSDSVLTYPVGIIDNYSPVGGRVFNLIYNLIFGGWCGFIGSIYGFIVRNYVMVNQQVFRDIEDDFLSVNSIMRNNYSFKNINL